MARRVEEVLEVWRALERIEAALPADADRRLVSAEIFEIRAMLEAIRHAESVGVI